MRIGAGKFGGRLLRTPRGESTRPTSGIVRETLFNIITTKVPESRFLDLFAGCGSVGLEALSRGATHATLVEKSRPAAACLRANVETLGVENQTMLLSFPVAKALEQLAEDKETYDLIFLDPPFADVQAYIISLLEKIDVGKMLVADGILVVQHGARTTLPEHVGKLQRYRLHPIGDNALSFYRVDDESATPPAPETPGKDTGTE